MNRSPRYSLLPMWIQVFAWIFLAIGGSVGVFEFIGAILGGHGNLSLHGLRYSGPMRAPWPLALGAVFTFYGYAAYLLLWGKKEGRKAGLAAGYLGMALCSLAIVVSLSGGRIYIPLEPILQLPFVLELHRLKNRWEAEPNQSTPANALDAS